MKLLRMLFLLSIFFGCLLVIVPARVQQSISYASQIEQPCPANTIPFIPLQTVNERTQQYRQLVCIDAIGNITFYGSYDGQSQGTFSNTQMGEPDISKVGPCSPEREFQAIQGANFATDAMSACLAVPRSATVHNADAVAAYANSSSESTNAVGTYAQSRCLVDSSNCWGGNSVATDRTGLTSGIGLVAHEFDTQPRNPPSAYHSLLGGLFSLFAPHHGVMKKSFAVYINAPESGTWDTGIVTQNGEAATFASVGAECKSGTCNSQPMKFTALNAGSQVQVSLGSDSNGDIILTPAAGASTNTTQFRLSPIPFEGLPPAPDGTLVYCADCTATAQCNPGGTGAIAKRLNGYWVCN